LEEIKSEHLTIHFFTTTSKVIKIKDIEEETLIDCGIIGFSGVIFLLMETLLPKVLLSPSLYDHKSPITSMKVIKVKQSAF
jgi:hypothetical protein